MVKQKYFLFLVGEAKTILISFSVLVLFAKCLEYVIFYNALQSNMKRMRLLSKDELQGK